MFFVQRSKKAGLLHRLRLGTVLLPLAASPFLISQAAKPAANDTLVFTNDEQLTGELLSADSVGITFRSPVAGEVKIPWDHIKDLKSDKSFAVIPKDQKLTRKGVSAAVPRGPVEVQNQAVEINGGKAVPTGNVDQVITESDFDKAVNHSPGFFGGWTGALSAGASFVRATQNSTTFTGAVSLTRSIPAVSWLPPRNRTLILYNQAYGSTSQTSLQTIKTNIFHAEAERDEYISRRLYVLGDVAFDHNFSQGLDLQQQYGGGFGYTVLKSAVQELDIKADVHYEKQHFFAVPPSPERNLNLIGSTFGENYFRKLPHTIVLTEFASISPAWNDTSAYSATFGANLVFPVYRGFAFNVGATDDYLNNAVDPFKKNSTTFTSGITYTFQQK